jgi:TfoX/Sxy family transcriptional regulator of competence genes
MLVHRQHGPEIPTWQEQREQHGCQDYYLQEEEEKKVEMNFSTCGEPVHLSKDCLDRVERKGKRVHGSKNVNTVKASHPGLLHVDGE